MGTPSPLHSHCTAARKKTIVTKKDKNMNCEDGTNYSVPLTILSVDIATISRF